MVGGTWGTALYTVRGAGSGSRDVDAWRANALYAEGRGERIFPLDTFRSIGLDHTVFHEWLIKQTNAILTLGSLGRSSRDFSGRNTLKSDSLAARTSAFLQFKFQEATDMETAEDNIFRRSKMQIHAAFSRASFVMRDHFLARTRSLTR